MGCARHFSPPEAARRWISLDIPRLRNQSSNRAKALFTCVVYTEESYPYDVITTWHHSHQCLTSPIFCPPTGSYFRLSMWPTSMTSLWRHLTINMWRHQYLSYWYSHCRARSASTPCLMTRWTPLVCPTPCSWTCRPATRRSAPSASTSSV